MEERLERVRGAMTDVEFAQLVVDVARTAQRFAEIDARQVGRPYSGIPENLTTAANRPSELT